MKMIRVIVVGLLYLTISTGAKAQNVEKAKHGQEIMQQLDLSKEQQKSMKTINKKYRSNIEVVKENQTLSKSIKRAQVQSLRKDKDQEIKGVLTEAQYIKLQNAKAEKKEGKKKKKADDLKAELDLTDKQSQELQAIKDKYQPQIRAVKGNESLTEDQRKVEIKELKDQKKKEVEGILTKDQLIKMKSLKKSKKKGAKK